MPVPRGKIAIGALAVVIVVLGGVWAAVKWLSPGVVDRRPSLGRDAPTFTGHPQFADRACPRSSRSPPFATRWKRRRVRHPASSKFQASPYGMPNPYGGGKAPDITWSFSRGTFALSGGPDGLFLSTALSGTLRATGQFGPPGMDGIPPGFRGPPGLSPSLLVDTDSGTSEQRIDISGNVELTARPSLLPDWRVQPNLTASVTIGQASVDIMGMKFSLSEGNEAHGGADRQRAGRVLAVADGGQSFHRTGRDDRNGPRCAVRSRSARLLPACQISGWKYVRLERSRRSPASTDLRSRSRSA